MGYETDKELYDFVYPHIKDKLIFDAGSNRGEVTKKFVNNGAYVIAIEPQKEITDNKNYDSNRVLAIENICLSDKIEELTFYKGDSKHSTISSCFFKWKNDHPTVKWAEVKMKTDTLDNLIAKYGVPIYIKIDTEGWEPKILKGLHYKIPYISFEFTYGYQKEFYNCMNEIKRLGFKEASTFIKKKIKKVIDGRRKTVRQYKIIDEFKDIKSILKFFDKLPKGSQGDILIRN